MPKLMHISGSPRRDASSGAGARAFIENFRERRPSFDLDELDLWRAALPEFNQTMIEAKDAVMAGRDFTEAQRSAWADIERMVVRISLADRLLISTPMWNFSLPYKVKHYFDLINQPRLTFRFDPAHGYIPLLKNRPTLVILSSSGDFVTGMNRGRIDMATPYLREVLKFMGVTDVQVVRMGPTAGPREETAAARDAAMHRLRDIAARF